MTVFQYLTANSSKSVQELIELVKVEYKCTKKEAREWVNAWIRA